MTLFIGDSNYRCRISVMWRVYTVACQEAAGRKGPVLVVTQTMHIKTNIFTWGQQFYVAPHPPFPLLFPGVISMAEHECFRDATAAATTVRQAAVTRTTRVVCVSGDGAPPSTGAYISPSRMAARAHSPPRAARGDTMATGLMVSSGRQLPGFKSLRLSCYFLLATTALLLHRYKVLPHQ